MNQNFKKHLQASYTRAFEECSRTGHKIGDLDAIFNSIVMETFAELIVRECINKIETYRIPVGNSAAGEMACEWTYDALKEIRDDIRKHFGVES